MEYLVTVSHKRNWHANKGTEERRIYNFDIFATSSLDGMCGQHHAAAASSQRKTQLLGWLGLRAGLDGHVKTRCPRDSIPRRPTYTKLLYRLLYPDAFSVRWKLKVHV
jgi:hypothetical protein